jgi:hypothetical protein
LHHCRRESVRQERFSTLGQVQRAGSTIGGTVSSFEKTIALEVVDYGHHRARRDYQLVADYLLGLALIAVHRVQHGEVSRLEPQCADHFAELTGRLETYLRKREAHRVRRSGPTGVVGSCVSVGEILVHNSLYCSKDS